MLNILKVLIEVHYTSAYIILVFHVQDVIMKMWMKTNVDLNEHIKMFWELMLYVVNCLNV